MPPKNSVDAATAAFSPGSGMPRPAKNSVTWGKVFSLPHPVVMKTAPTVIRISSGARPPSGRSRQQAAAKVEDRADDGHGDLSYDTRLAVSRDLRGPGPPVTVIADESGRFRLSRTAAPATLLHREPCRPGKSATHRGRATAAQLEALGALPGRAAVGHGARGLLRGRRPAGTTFRTTTPAAAPTAGARTACSGICDRQCRLCFALALWNGQDPHPQGAPVRPDRPRGQPRRGRQGVLLLPRLDADAFLLQGAVQVSAAGVPVRRPGRGEPRGAAGTIPSSSSSTPASSTTTATSTSRSSTPRPRPTTS